MSALVWPKNAKWTPNSSSSHAFGPDLGGQHVLVITNDNDFLSTPSNNFYVFAIDPGDLSYVAQAIHAVPEPSSYLLIVAGLCGLLVMRARRG